MAVMYDIVIIGAGPAGLTAAIYARRAMKSVLVLEARAYGGQIINTPDIENYPAEPHISGFDLAVKMYEQAKALGAEFIFERAEEIRNDDSGKTVVTAKNEFPCKAVIIAVGSQNRKLGVDGEDSFVGRGISYCATCDGAFYRNKITAVVGGGNTALEDALYLSDIAATVYLIHRRDGFRGEESTVELLKKKENVVFVLNSRVTRLIGEKKLESIEITDSGSNVSTIKLDGLFVAVGRVPENDAFSPLITLDASGYIPAGEDCRTNVDGIFAAGDNRAKTLRQLVTATSDGAASATAAVQYIAAS